GDPALTCHIERAFCFEILRWMPAFAGMSGVCGKIQARGIARILVSAPGRPSHAPEKIEGSGAPGNAEACEASWTAGAAARDACEASPLPLRSGKGASRRSTGGDFGSRARASGWGPTHQRRLSGRLPPPFSPTASSHSRQPVIVPADGCPRPPECEVTSLARGRRILLHLRHVSGRRPSVRAGRKEEKHGHGIRSIVLDRNIRPRPRLREREPCRDSV